MEHVCNCVHDNCNQGKLGVSLQSPGFQMAQEEYQRKCGRQEHGHECVNAGVTEIEGMIGSLEDEGRDKQTCKPDDTVGDVAVIVEERGERRADFVSEKRDGPTPDTVRNGQNDGRIELLGEQIGNDGHGDVGDQSKDYKALHGCSFDLEEVEQFIHGDVFQE